MAEPICFVKWFDTLLISPIPLATDIPHSSIHHFFKKIFTFLVADCPFTLRTITRSLFHVYGFFFAAAGVFFFVIFSVADAMHRLYARCECFCCNFIRCISQFYHTIIHQCTLHLHSSCYCTACLHWKLLELHCLKKRFDLSFDFGRKWFHHR